MIQAHAQEAQHERRDAHRLVGTGYGLQKLRTGHVHKEHLHGQRGVLVKLHVHAAYGAQHARASGREHAQQRAQYQRQQ